MMINIREKINMIIYRDPLLRFVQTGNDPIAILTFCQILPQNIRIPEKISSIEKTYVLVKKSECVCSMHYLGDDC